MSILPFRLRDAGSVTRNMNLMVLGVTLNGESISYDKLLLREGFSFVGSIFLKLETFSCEGGKKA